MKLEPEALWFWKNSPKNQNRRFFDFQRFWNRGPRDYVETLHNRPRRVLVGRNCAVIGDFARSPVSCRTLGEDRGKREERIRCELTTVVGRREVWRHFRQLQVFAPSDSPWRPFRWRLCLAPSLILLPWVASLGRSFWEPECRRGPHLSWSSGERKPGCLHWPQLLLPLLLWLWRVRRSARYSGWKESMSKKWCRLSRRSSSMAISLR